VVLDDHPVVRAGLTQTFNMEPDMMVCGEAVESTSAIKWVRAHRPDLVLQDIALDAGSRPDLVRRIREREEGRR